MPTTDNKRAVLVQPPTGARLKAPPLERSSLRESATRLLRAEIVSGIIQPGEIYAIGDIAAQLGTSPTPIREALLELVGQGLVVMVRNRGFRVSQLSGHDLDEVFELRSMLEVPAMGRLAELDPAPDLLDARALADQTVDAASTGDLNAFLALDRDFHMLLTSKLGNGRLVAMVAQLRDQTRLYGLDQEVPRAKAVRSAQDHIDLTEAVRDGDRRAAERIMRDHLSQIRLDWARSAPVAHATNGRRRRT